MKKRILFFSLLHFLPITAYAFFCPTNFNQIDYGNSIEEVIQQCGKPDNEKGSLESNDKIIPQEWNYFIYQTVATTNLSPVQGTLKTSITFDENDKAINISVNGIGVGSTTICNQPIQLGDSKETVKAACGEPSFINRQQNANVPPIVVSRFFYNTNPPATLIFENGRLKEKQ